MSAIDGQSIEVPRQVAQLVLARSVDARRKLARRKPICTLCQFNDRPPKPTRQCPRECQRKCQYPERSKQGVPGLFGHERQVCITGESLRPRKVKGSDLGAIGDNRD